MNKLLLVDGSNLLFQMFFGMPSRIVNHQGKAIQGTLGFVGALLRMIKITAPTHIAVLFDGEHENDRVLLDADYKANRADYSQKPAEESPFSQLADVYAALDFLHIAHSETTDCEADDMIASYARTYGRTMQVVIASLDSDFYQLITDNISVLRYRGKQTVLFGFEELKEKLSVTPDQYVDFKSLTGDSSDNIKGAPRVGPKTAARLLEQFGSLNQMIADARAIAQPSIRASILEHRERLLKNYQLIKLNRKTAPPWELPALSYGHCPLSTNEVLLGIGLKKG